MSTSVMNKLPKPPSSEPHSSESHKLVRERSFPSTQNISDILHYLKLSRSTGQLLVDIGQGGVVNVRFREEHKVKFEE